MIFNKGFNPKRSQDDRLPPGQYETKDFPVLSLGPTPKIDIKQWQFEVLGLVNHPTEWNWFEFEKLPTTHVQVDIHCVTKWSKFDTKWKGVSLDEIIKMVGLQDGVTHIIATSYDGYTTNLPLKDIINGQAMVATSYISEDPKDKVLQASAIKADGEAGPYNDHPITSEHGGPARLLVPHLYFWKSAKWLKSIEFVNADQPGFWETRGYHNYGDPWKEQRYDFDT